MMFDSWINDFEETGVATMEIDERRICTFCNGDGVCAVKFGTYLVHLCEVHAFEH